MFERVEIGMLECTGLHSIDFGNLKKTFKLVLIFKYTQNVKANVYLRTTGQ